MKVFFINIIGFRPYPITKEYCEKASNFGTAVNRAIKKYLKETKGKKRLKNMVIKVKV